MMVYKYWDSITKEDLEFSVGSKAAVWEVKDPLLSAAPMTGGGGYGTPMTGGPGGGMGGYGPGAGGYAQDDDGSNYHAPASLVGGVSGGQYYASHGYPPQNGYGN